MYISCQLVLNVQGICYPCANCGATKRKKLHFVGSTCCFHDISVENLKFSEPLGDIMMCSNPNRAQRSFLLQNVCGIEHSLSQCPIFGSGRAMAMSTAKRFKKNKRNLNRKCCEN